MKKYKLVVYVPLSHADVVREAIGAVGGGRLGNYSSCSFSTKGTGRFKPEEGATPHIGEVGAFESVEEERVEVTVGGEILDETISAMKKAHPYDEIAYDIYLLETQK